METEAKAVLSLHGISESRVKRREWKQGLRRGMLFMLTSVY